DQLAAVVWESGADGPTDLEDVASRFGGTVTSGSATFRVACFADGRAASAAVAEFHERFASARTARNRVAGRAAAHLGGGDPAIVVDVAMHLATAAHDGQVLMSAAFRAAVGAPAVWLGPHQLSDLREPIEVWQWRATGDNESFPPLRSLNRVAHNL